MGDEVDIRTMGPADVSLIGPLFQAHTGRPADLATLRRWVTSSPGTLATKADEVVGYAITKPFAPDLAELASLLVAPAERTRGLGARLVQHVEQACRSRSLAGIVLVSSDGYATLGPRTDPVAFYGHLGYRVVMETEISTVMVHPFEGHG